MKSMNSQKKMSCPNYSDAFYGSATVGERGQIVIPAEARAELGYQPGEKVLIMRHPMHHGLVVFKIDVVREFMDDFAKMLTELTERSEMEEPEK